MRQYLAMRRSLPEDVLLFFRLGDFYELFFDDAKEAASVLEVALTKRNGIPMCGVPHHSAEGYIGKLIRAGRRVAIAEQTTDPMPGKIVEREVRQIVSAGTVNDFTLLESDRPNHLAAVYESGRKVGLACVDLSTGEFRVTELDSGGQLEDELARLAPSEILVSDEQEEAFGFGGPRQVYDGYAFLPEQARFLLREHFRVQSLDGFGCREMEAGIGAAGAVLHYLTSQMRRKVGHIRRLRSYQLEDRVMIDAASQANLELVESRSGPKHTLLHALDRTRTPMGARRLRDWVLQPCRDLATLEARQGLIGRLVGERFILQ